MTGRTHARTVGANQTRAVLMYNQDSACHIDDRNPLADADDQLDARAGGFHNGIGSAGAGHKNTGCVGSRCGSGLGNCIENGQTFNGFSTLAGSDAANYICTGCFHIASMKLSLAPGNALHNYTCFIINQNTHGFSPCVLPECAALALPFDSVDCEAVAAIERRCRVAFQGSDRAALARRISADSSNFSL